MTKIVIIQGTLREQINNFCENIDEIINVQVFPDEYTYLETINKYKPTDYMAIITYNIKE